MSELVVPYIFNILKFHSPKKLIFGPDASSRVSEELSLKKDEKVLIVTDEGIEKAGIVDKITSHLEEKELKFEIYDKVEADPTIEVAEEVAKVAREGNYGAVIGLGGGSSMDMAKVASFSVANPGNIRDYVGRGLVKQRGIPIICIPTTAGTGSEVTMVSVVTLGKIKRAVISPHLMPDVSIVDPKLTVTLPPRQTAGSGLDALSHAIEGILSILANPLSMSLGLEAVRLISENLRVAFHNGRDLEARYHMSLAATIAGLSFNDPGVLYGHSIAQTFSPMYNVPHGISCAMTLPYIMEFYIPVVPEKLALIADAMGQDIFGLDLFEAAKAAVEAVLKLNEDLKIPTLQDYGAQKDELPELAKICVEEWTRPNSPRQLTEETALEILNKMWRGSID